MLTGNADGARAKLAPNLKEEIKMQELNTIEVDEVSGGIIFAPVAVKIIAWAAGAAFGAGLVVAVKYALS